MEKIRISPEMKNWRSAHILADRFIGRWDVYAKQLADGRYVSIKEPLHGRYIIDHLKGKITLGAYVLDTDSQAKFTVLDADDDRGRKRLTELARQLSRKRIPSYIEGSRRGCHLWFFFAEPIPGKNARAFGQMILKSAEIDDVEVFPKQDELTTGPGSLIRLPFGVHQVSGERYSFLDPDGKPVAKDIHSQIQLLKTARTVQKNDIRRYVRLASRQEIQQQINGEQVPIWDRIKQVMPVADFVGEYVELTNTASGYVGYCPFHDDSHKSFGVNEEGNFWNCFAGCGGGSIIDFYMLYKGVDFKTACDELGDLFGVRPRTDNGRSAVAGGAETNKQKDLGSSSPIEVVVYQAATKGKKQS